MIFKCNINLKIRMSVTNTKSNINIKMGEEPFESKKVNHKTRMCKNMQLYGKCSFSPCIFAHSLKELRIPECNYKHSCIFTTIEDGVCKNAENTNKICYFRHNETDEQYHNRVGNTKTPMKSVCKVAPPLLCAPVKSEATVENKEESDVIEPKKLDFEGDTWTKIVNGKKKTVIEKQTQPAEKKLVLSVENGDFESLVSQLTKALTERVKEVTLNISYN